MRNMGVDIKGNHTDFIKWIIVASLSSGPLIEDGGGCWSFLPRGDEERGRSMSMRSDLTTDVVSRVDFGDGSCTGAEAVSVEEYVTGESETFFMGNHRLVGCFDVDSLRSEVWMGAGRLLEVLAEASPLLFPEEETVRGRLFVSFALSL